MPGFPNYQDLPTVAKKYKSSPSHIQQEAFEAEKPKKELPKDVAEAERALEEAGCPEYVTLHKRMFVNGVIMDLGLATLVASGALHALYNLSYLKSAPSPDRRVFTGTTLLVGSQS